MKEIFLLIIKTTYYIMTSSMEEQVNSDDQSEVSAQTIPPIKDLRLGKRLAYLLRYGAEKEGLQVREGGFVDIDELMTVPLLRHHQKQEVLREVRESTSYRGHKRFEERPEKDRTLVRALYRRRFERNPYHDGTKVPRLLEVCMEFVCNNIKQFDLECFQDDFIVNCMLHKLRRRRQLTNAVLRSLLSRSLDSLDLHDMYFTNGTARILVQKCPALLVEATCMLHKLRRRRQLTNPVLRSLLSRSLDSLDLHDMYFTNGTAKILAQKCSTNLEMSCAPLRRRRQLTNAVLRNLLSRSLDSLDLHDMYFTNGTARILAQKCPALPCMLHKLRRRRQLTNAVLRSLLSRSLDSLDLHDMYFTNGTARILVQKCPALRKLSLRDAGYAVNDQVVTMLVKNLPNLVSLNLCGCKQVTQRSLQVINKYIPLIQHLNLGMIPLPQESLVDFVENSSELLHLDVSENNLLIEEGAKLLAAICLSRNITFVSHFKF
ncbi:uncharacterized protein LOC144866864 [Branchiostoma floridae x Branchiostoma japonicum]